MERYTDCRLTREARTRMEHRGMTARELFELLDFPGSIRPNGMRPGTVRLISHDNRWCAIVNPTERVVITIHPADRDDFRNNDGTRKVLEHENCPRELRPY